MTANIPGDSAITRHRITFFIKAAEAAQRTLTEPHLKKVGLTYVQFAMLMSIDRLPRASAAELARRIGITPQSVGEIIAALLRKGLVSRSEDESSRRILRLGLRPAGKKLLAEAEAMLDRIEREWTGGIDPADLATTKAVLAALVRRGAGPGALPDA